jgi:hypothetical protein
MSDAVLASIIAAGATVLTAFLQLRHSIGREIAARGQGTGTRRKGRAPTLMLFVMLFGAGVGGFAFSQWLSENERSAQSVLQHELQARVEEIGRTASQLEVTRAGARAEIETEVLRRIGTDGVVVMATVAPCHPALVVSPPGSATPPGVSATPTAPPTPSCTEPEANSVTLCATIPARATVSEVELFARFVDADTPWSANRALAGQETGQARFAEKYTETDDNPGTKQVCQGFAHWSADHARVARMVVRYTL